MENGITLLISISHMLTYIDSLSTPMKRLELSSIFVRSGIYEKDFRDFRGFWTHLDTEKIPAINTISGF
jgi:hypothetical protein